MARFPVPKIITGRISDRAAQIAREDVQRRGWKSGQAIVADPQHGKVGLRVNAKHLMYQDRGTEPHIQWELSGKTIPMSGPGGRHYRYANPQSIGTPGWVSIPTQHGEVRKWRDQRWRHPGLKPQYFLENAIQQAVKEHTPGILKFARGLLVGEHPNVSE
jgi:hypothetical protein